MSESMMSVRSLVSDRTREPIVEIEFGGKAGQLDYASAIQLSQQIAGAAEAALQDAAIINWAMSDKGPGWSRNEAGALLLIIRDYRDELMKGQSTGPVEGS